MQYDMQGNTMNTTQNENNDKRPFGYWITAVDRLMRAEFATAFEDEGITRRDWRMLNRVDGAFAATAASGRPLNPHKLQRLLELDWVERTDDGWGLTESGTLAKQRLSNAVDEIRARVAGAVSPEEYATMTEALEKIASEFGWAEGRRLPHSEGRDGRGHSRGRRSGGRHSRGQNSRGQQFGGERWRDPHSDARRGGRSGGRGEHFEGYERFGDGERFGRFGDFGYGERFGDFGPDAAFGHGERFPRGDGFERRTFGRHGKGGGHRFPRHARPASHIHIHHHHD